MFAVSYSRRAEPKPPHAPAEQCHPHATMPSWAQHLFDPIEVFESDDATDSAADTCETADAEREKPSGPCRFLHGGVRNHLCARINHARGRDVHTNVVLSALPAVCRRWARAVPCCTCGHAPSSAPVRSFFFAADITGRWAVHISLVTNFETDGMRAWWAAALRISLGLLCVQAHPGWSINLLILFVATQRVHCAHPHLARA